MREPRLCRFLRSLGGSDRQRESEQRSDTGSLHQCGESIHSNQTPEELNDWGKDEGEEELALILLLNGS